MVTLWYSQAGTGGLSLELFVPKPFDTLVKQHEAIASAIAARDPERAETAMRVHLGEILKSLPKLAEAHPDLFAA
jgi:DNA-binding GntR family transcriptional regulator